MADDLYTISLIADDKDFFKRLVAAAAKSGITGDVRAWTYQHRHILAAAPTWGEKVEYWRNTTTIGSGKPLNGWALDLGVITNDDILAQVAAVKAAEPPESAVGVAGFEPIPVS